MRNNSTVSWMNFVSLFTIAFALFLTIWVFLTSNKNNELKRLEIISLVSFSITFLLYVHAQILTNAHYSTDEIAFDQYAANLFAHGQNPYSASLLNSLHFFRVPQVYWTYTTNGQIIQHLSYPALSFLLYVPFVKLSAFSGLYVDAVFWVIAIWLMHFSLPSPYKSIALFFGSCLVFIDYTVWGITDSLFMPFLIILAWKWTWYYDKQGLAKYVPPIVLGFAMAIKQTAWFLFPIAVVAVYKETKSLAKTLTYVLVTVISFLLPNVYFIIRDPLSWIKGVFEPFFSGLLPSGQGTITVPMFQPIGGGHLSLYTLAAILLLLAMLADEWINYVKLKEILFVLPAIVLFFPIRSFAQYLIDFLPVLFIAFFNRHVVTTKVVYRRQVLLLYTPFLLVLSIALATPSPIRINNVKMHYSTELGGINQIELTVKNKTSHNLQPSITLLKNSIYQPFWKIVDFNKSLNPKTEVQYTIVPSSAKNVDTLDGGFYIELFATNPKSVSISPLYVPSRWKTNIQRNRRVLSIQVLDQSGQVVEIENLPVYIQEISCPSGEILGTSKLDTNQSGSVHMSINPTSTTCYQAYLVGVYGRYGFSPIIN